MSELLVAKNDLSGSTKMNVINVVINSLNKIEHRLWEEVPLTKGEKEFVFHVVAEAESKLMVSDVMEFVHTNKMFESIVDKDGYTSFVIASKEQ
jgi:2-hydroxy-3-keto-5-methylthiopentenyl-1-phosphate phosphatase